MIQNNITISNQPYLLNKYQINMGFAYFRGTGILSGINILTPYKINDVMWFPLWEVIIFLYLYFFYQLIMILTDGSNIYLIFYY